MCVKRTVIICARIIMITTSLRHEDFSPSAPSRISKEDDDDTCIGREHNEDVFYAHAALRAPDVGDVPVCREYLFERRARL